MKIGDLGSKVFQEWGDDFETIVNVGGSGNATYNYFSYPKGIDIIFGQHGSGDLDINTLPIQRFDLFEDFEGATPEGIKIGSTRSEVIAVYGEPDEKDTTFAEINVYYIGMLIKYDDMDKVRYFTIMEI